METSAHLRLPDPLDLSDLPSRLLGDDIVDLAHVADGILPGYGLHGHGPHGGDQAVAAIALPVAPSSPISMELPVTVR